jgi:hypothetical protein
MSADKTVRKVTDLKAQRMETYRYWLGRTAAERMDAVEEIVRSAYFAKGIDLDCRPADKRLIRRIHREWKAA